MNLKHSVLEFQSLSKNSRMKYSQIFLFVYILSNIIHCFSKIWKSSCPQLYIVLVNCAHSWDIKLNSRREIPYEHAPILLLLLLLLLLLYNSLRISSFLLHIAAQREGILSSHQLNIVLVQCAHSWDIKLNSRREIAANRVP